jgi:hypothetical protein
MSVKSIFYKYKLECGHDAQATILWYTKREPKEPIAFHPGDIVKCQPCGYAMRKILLENKEIVEE